MGFWDWAVVVHGRPGVEAALLDLQDEHGQCVVYLLWAAWAAAQGSALSAEALARGVDLAGRWQSAAVGPLRAARRALKTPVTPIDDAAREALREQVRTAEFAAERLLMETLERMAPPASGAPLPVAGAIAAACGAWPTGAPQEALDDLAARLD